MKRSGCRLAVAAVLFAAWIGFLAYLAATTTNPVVLSRPQFLVADLYVVADVGTTRFWPTYPILVAAPAGGPAAAALLPVAPADVTGPGEVITVHEVVWAANPSERNLSKIYVRDLPHGGVKVFTNHEASLEWPGPGRYLLALSHTSDGPGVFRLTPVPRTPGYPGHQADRGLGNPFYRATPDTLKQLGKLTAEYHPQ